MVFGRQFLLSLSPSLYASLHPSSPAHYEEQQFLSEPAVKVCSGVKIAPQFGSHLHHLSLGPRKAAGCPKRGGAPRLPALAPARLGQAGPGRAGIPRRDPRGAEGPCAPAGLPALLRPPPPAPARDRGAVWRPSPRDSRALHWSFFVCLFVFIISPVFSLSLSGALFRFSLSERV